MMIAIATLLPLLHAADATEEPPVRQYHVFDEEDWFRGHLDDTECLDVVTNTTALRMDTMFCPVANPYSTYTPLYTKLGSTCDEDSVCCLAEEEECPGGEVTCSYCEDCMYPQAMSNACCTSDEGNVLCSEDEICCKCGPDLYECIDEGEECRECPTAPTYTPDMSEWMTTPTPTKLVHEEL